ncbi:hypothetical protein CPB84DRAFT_1812174 [Gymnopilus junonius]|uniref:Uncharacterized protein n=1 Tax=Gymnopilus junonius TaxID=109634 RepID=A0A9P5NZF4_GYMJU|nr:hypothetical protein CPB84DRAFT_1812174 [Gymnopilus junonius]
MRHLPTDIFLLSLPHLLAHPPTHKHHSRSSFLSLFALRKYLSLPNLESTLECRAWTELAEVGLRIGLNVPGIEEEVEKAVTKALIIANKHPSLRVFKSQISQLSARLAMHQGNHKLAQNALKKVLNGSTTLSDPLHIKYSAHLAYINSLSKVPGSDDLSPYSDSSLRSLSAIREFHELALRNNHYEVALFSMVLELLDLVRHGIWNRVKESLINAERACHLAPELVEVPKAPSPAAPSVVLGKTNIEKVLIVHILLIGAVYYTYVGEANKCQLRIKRLHDMLDGGALDAFASSGLVEIDLPDLAPLVVQVTHPRIIFALGFLVSSASKRDPVGRKPKRKLFASEGILVVDRELRKDASLPIWSSTNDTKGHCKKFLQMKADMMCEVIGVCILRSEFDDADLKLSQLIADARTSGLFSLYSARITLHKAHLAHCLGQTDRALKCYQVAAYLSRRRSSAKVVDIDGEGCEDPWVNASARAGELWLKIGLAGELVDVNEREREMEILRKNGSEVIKTCAGLGGTLQAVGEVLAACLAKEFLVTKTHLRAALNLSTEAQDNHLRALVLTLVAAQYVHTSTEHAQTMLTTAEQLAAGLGAQPKGVKDNDNKKVYASNPLAANGKLGGDGVGNAYLRLWIGERSLELKRRSGDEKGAAIQAVVNKNFKEAVTKLQKRKYRELQ